MQVDHIAVNAAKLVETVNWYVKQFGASVLYQDETWAFLKIGGTKLALLTPGQHPPHLAFAIVEEQLDELAQRYGASVQSHRDGTRSFYTADPSGNAVEVIAYPPGHAYQSSGG